MQADKVKERLEEKARKAHEKSLARKRKVVIPPIKELKKKYKGKPPEDEVILIDAVTPVVQGDIYKIDTYEGRQRIITKSGKWIINSNPLEALKDTATVSGMILEFTDD